MHFKTLQAAAKRWHGTIGAPYPVQEEADAEFEAALIAYGFKPEDPVTLIEQGNALNTDEAVWVTFESGLQVIIPV